MIGHHIYLVTLQMQGTLRRDTTWWRVERPTLLAHGHTTITYVNANDFSDRKEFSLSTGRPARKRDIDTPFNETRIVASASSPSLTGYALNWKGYGDAPGSQCAPFQTGFPYSAGWYVIVSFRVFMVYPYLWFYVT